MNKEIEHCKYADSCFECPMPDCVAYSSNAYKYNKTEYDIYEREYLKEVKRKGNYKKCQK